MTETLKTTSGTPIDPANAWADALNRGDPDGVAACFAADGVMIDIGTGQRAEGREAIRAAATNFLGMFSDFRIEKTVTLHDDVHYADEWVISGVHTGDAPGLPATGRSVRFYGAGVGEVRDGLIVRGTEYWNMADVLTQIGVMPS